jgi:peptide/nickel transport system permease protein
MSLKTYFLSRTVLQKICLLIIALYLIVSFTADFIANDKPLYCICKGETVFPIAKSYLEIIGLSAPTGAFDYKDCNSKLMPWIPFHANTLDPFSNGYAAPLATSSTGIHILGTDALGKDVLAGLIHGTRYAFIIGLASTLFSLIPGVFIGMMMGFWQNHKLSMNYLQAFVFFLLTVLFLFELNTFYTAFNGLTFIFILVLLLFIFCLLSYTTWRMLNFNVKKFVFPLDNILMRCIEIFESFPKLLILMTLIVLTERPGIFSLILLIAVIRWPLFAQISRAETLRVSKLNFTLSAENIGVHWFSILGRHIWPNIKETLLVTALFSFSAAILLEASLSFIGLGLKLDQVSWGSLLNEGRQYFPGWWLSLFPGLAIFLLVLALNWLFDNKSKSISA